MAVQSSISKKRLPEHGGEGSPSKIKCLSKPSAVRDFPANCGLSKPSAVRDFPVNCGLSKPSAVRDFPFDCGPNAGIQSPVKCSSTAESSPSNFSEKSCPLASGTSGARTEKGFYKLENPKISDDICEEIGLGDEQELDSLGPEWESAVENVAGVIVLAREFVAFLDGECSTSKHLTDVAVFADQMKLMDTTKTLEDVVLARILSQSVAEQNLDDNLGETKSDDVGDKICVLSPQDAKLCALFDGEDGGVVVGSQGGGETIDLDDDSVSEKNGTCCEKYWLESQFLDSNQSEVEKEQGGSTDDFTTYDTLSSVEFKDTSDAEPKCYQTLDELVNLCIVKHDQPEGCKVREVLKKFEEHYEALLKEQNSEAGEGQRGKKYAHIEAGDRLKAEGMCISVQKPFGHIPGIEVGDTFRFKAQLAVVGLHRNIMCGIDYVTIGGEKFATCVVDSGRYENEAGRNDYLIYSGQGGNPKLVEKAADQKLIKGNLAMVNSMEMGYPVRFIRKRKSRMKSYGFGHANCLKYVYEYDGLYTVKNYWQERDQNGSLVFKFKLIRMSDQPSPRQIVACSGKLMLPCKEFCDIHDLSQGLENHEIRVMNGIDDLIPPPFTYTNKIIYPNWYSPMEPIGCNCINGCSDSHQCPCVVKNGGEIPFNEKGLILRERSIVHECGPNCKCPPSCMNRVSQHGPRIRLEIFKTKERGWGVRTRDNVASGSFICEYIGEMLREDEAEQRIGNDEYLFDIGDGHNDDGELEGRDAFVIDACKFGNAGRFVNHSCSPNMYAQEVLYDHDDVKMPHIMFFANRRIPALHELTYDYNYKVDRVCDANGNIKKKHCFCGSPICNGRMY